MANNNKQIACDHCGENCVDEIIDFDQKHFCCVGCKTVYEILSTNDLCDYYEIDTPNVQVKTAEFGNKYAFLDNEEIAQKLYHFIEGEYRIVKLFAPVIHCASCIWLLENLNRLVPGIQSSKVNFVKKEVTVHFNINQVSLRQIVEMMASIGYPPNINLQQSKDDGLKKKSKDLLVKLGVAGFSFGNIMLMSFPEYLSFQFQDEAFYIEVFAWLNLLLSLPLIFYCAQDYFVSAYKGISHKIINIDVPIALGMSVLFLRSAYDIISSTGPGYLDSLAGLVFFLLVGKWFQSKTYQALSFERDYKSYFPLAVNLIENNRERSILANQLKKGDQIIIRNEELIPADSILTSQQVEIDYSFVTGESRAVNKQKGDFIYAGGRLKGAAANFVVQEKVSQSYLTDLWNQSVFEKEENTKSYSSLIDKVSQYFTITIIAIALGSLAFWYVVNPTLAVESFTAVLIVACPCALALSLPFTLGNAIRHFGRFGLYLKNSQTVENLAKIDCLVFDKTGTLTTSNQSEVLFYGEKRLSHQQEIAVKAICNSSAHPISSAISKSIKENSLPSVSELNETSGAGIEGEVNLAGQNLNIKVGSKAFCNAKESVKLPHAFVQINGETLGYFVVKNGLREGLDKVLKHLQNQQLELHLISGDNSTDQSSFAELFAGNKQLHFNQSPQDKLNYIEKLQKQGKTVLMMGDGLNDAGALKAADVGIAISEDVYSFSPACDAILSAEQFGKLEQFLTFAKNSIKMVRWSFAISFLYNIVGLSFAVQGLLTPIVAAILMPLSSITIVIFATLSTAVIAKKISGG